MEKITYISSATLDGVRPIFVQDGFNLYVAFGAEIVEIPLGQDYGFPLPALAFINCYLGYPEILQETVH
jgi:hypothetical protein